MTDASTLLIPARPRRSLSVDRRIAVAILTALIISTVIFLHIHESVSQHFLFSGAEQDGYWLAGLIWRNSLALINPPTFFHPGHPSFFVAHFAPILHIGNLVSWVYAVDPIWNVAVFMAAMFSTIFLCVYFAALTAIRPASSAGIVLLGCLSALIIGTIVLVTSLSLPHWEFFIPAFVVLTLAAIAAQKNALAWLGLILCLSSREDAGLHLACALLPLIALDAVAGRRGPVVRLSRIFLATAVSYSAVVMIGVRVFFEIDDLFQRSYPGPGVPFAHLNIDFLLHRAALYWTQREYIVFPILMLIVFSITARDRYLAAGVASFLPWAALNVLAINDVAGTMSWYYGFPILVLICWPLIVAAWTRGIDDLERRPPQYLLMFSVLVISACWTSHPNVGNGHRWPVLAITALNNWFHASLDKADTQAVSHQLRKILEDEQPSQLGIIRVNGGVVGLMPDLLTRSHRISDPVWDETYRAGDTVIFLGFSYDCLQLDGFIQANGLPRLFHFSGTNIFAVSIFDLGTILGPSVAVREIRRIADAQRFTQFGCSKPGFWTPELALIAPPIPLRP